MLQQPILKLMVDCKRSIVNFPRYRYFPALLPFLAKHIAEISPALEIKIIMSSFHCFNNTEQQPGPASSEGELSHGKNDFEKEPHSIQQVECLS